MKRIYISADIEGIWGNVDSAYTMKNGYAYEQYRTHMIDETNIAIRTLFNHGVQEIVVNDGHGGMDNLVASQLDDRASLVISHGAYKEYGMMEGISSKFDGVCFIGYHCRSNTPGVMAHTIWGAQVRCIKINGKELGESGINAHLAWYYGLPVLLVSGDSLLNMQLKEELKGNYHFVETKQTINSLCAINCSKQQLIQRYDHEIRQALQDQYEIFPEDHYVIDITFHKERNASFVARIPLTTQIDACTVQIKGNDFDELYRRMRFMIKICNAFE